MGASSRLASRRDELRLAWAAMGTIPTNRPFRSVLACQAGIAVASLSRRIGAGEGSVVGGRVALALAPGVLADLAAGRRVALVSATNGKTTTTAMLTAALRTAGEVVTNGAGSNMFGGMVGALSRSNAQLAVLETDEAHLPKTIEDTKPALVVLLNLSRDQLDRVGEVRMQAAKWRDSLAKTQTIVVANADDPMVVWAARRSASVIWVEGGGSWMLDAASCPECGSRIEWNDKGWACMSCDLARPIPHARLTTDAPQTGELQLPVKTKVPGEINTRNACVALTAAVLMGADPVEASRAIANMDSVGGRYVEATISGIPVRLLLAKNPAGWAEALRIVNESTAPVVVSINARVQDGRDPSWLWDVPYETLTQRHVVATGDRSRDLAVRVRYAGLDYERCEDLVDAVKRAAYKASGQRIDVVANYSSFQDFRQLTDSSEATS